MNRKRRVKRRSIGSKGVTVSSASEAQQLRQRRMRRYKKRRAVLTNTQLKSASLNSGNLQSSSSKRSRPKAVLGSTQAKRPVKKRMTGTAVKPRSPKSQVPVLARKTPKKRVLKRVKKAKSLNLLRLILSGVGVALISGFVIALMHPEPPSGKANSDESSLQFQDNVEVKDESSQKPAQPAAVNYEQPGKELRQLKQELRNLVEKQSDLSTGLFFLNPETKEFVTYRGSEPFPAASMIKLPILIAFFQAVDEGKVTLDERLVMRPDLIVGEAGAMQYDEPGSDYGALQTADWMITISDNTATNMIMDRLGGADVLNKQFEDWGLVHTRINQPLPDLEGTNTMSPKDLAVLMAKVSQGDILTAHSRDRALEILRNTVTNTLLPQGISESAMIAHKTGDIGMAVGDAGLIDMPNGQRYVAGIVVKRPHNDPRAQELIRGVSKMTYKAFSDRPVPRPASPEPSSSESNTVIDVPPVDSSSSPASTSSNTTATE